MRQLNETMDSTRITKAYGGGQKTHEVLSQRYHRKVWCWKMTCLENIKPGCNVDFNNALRVSRSNRQEIQSRNNSLERKDGTKRSKKVERIYPLRINHQTLYVGVQRDKQTSCTKITQAVVPWAASLGIRTRK